MADQPLPPDLKVPRSPSAPQAPPSYHRRVFAHLINVDCACPDCGTVHLGTSQKQKATRHEGSGYSSTTGRFMCKNCRHVWILGVIFWPTEAAKFRATDTIPNPEQATVLREAASRRTLESRPTPRAPVNVIETEPLEAPALPRKHDDLK